MERATVTILSARWFRATALVAGLILPQAIEYGPSLVGARVLLPLDLLAVPGVYLADASAYGDIPPGNLVNLDKVVQYEPARRFAAAELRAGRFPTWSPYGHLGTPFVVSLSVFNFLYFALPGPATLAWMQLARAVVAGLGAFWFFRVAFKVEYWPAAVGGWLYPMTGFLVFWQGHYLADAAVWLPWVLLATDRAVCHPRGRGGPALVASLACVALTGVTDVIATTLVASGLYAIFRQLSERGRSLRLAAAPVATVLAGWIVGIATGACVLLPLFAFAQTGARIQERQTGAEERPPIGFAALPQVVLPWFQGTHERYDVPSYTGRLVLPESAATGSAGLLAALVAAPWALADRKRRAMALFCAALAVLGIAWQLNLPGLVWLERLPLFNLGSHNRDTLLTAFGILTLTVLGLDALCEGAEWRRLFWLPAAVLVALGFWSATRAMSPPGSLGDSLAAVVANPDALPAHVVRLVRAAGNRYAELSLWNAGLCAVGVAAWVALAWRKKSGPVAAAVLSAAMIVESFCSGFGYNTQSDPRLYYPPIPVLQRLEQAMPGRIVGIGCLTPNLASVASLSDIRGYDAVDPRRYVELLSLAGTLDPDAPRHARTQNFQPRVEIDANRHAFRVSPVLDLLGVRYIVLTGEASPALRAFDQGDGFTVIENPHALPRVFVPRRAAPAPDDAELLRQLKDIDFDPRQMAWVEGEPPAQGEANARAEIVRDDHASLEVRVSSDAAGTLVLADAWFEGWTATIDGTPAKVQRANYALRSVAIPQGKSTVVFEYRPSAVRNGLAISAAAVLVWIVWLAIVAVRRWRATGVMSSGRSNDTP